MVQGLKRNGQDVVDSFEPAGKQCGKEQLGTDLCVRWSNRTFPLTMYAHSWKDLYNALCSLCRTVVHLVEFDPKRFGALLHRLMRAASYAGAFRWST